MFSLLKSNGNKAKTVAIITTNQGLLKREIFIYLFKKRVNKF